MRHAERLMVCASRVVTCSEAFAGSQNPLGVIEQGAVLVENGKVVDVGPYPQLAATNTPVVGNVQQGVITPGLIDAHTHLVWAGSRHDEYILRMQGAGYEAIAAAGGGIVASMRSVRAASLEELAQNLTRRLRRMAALGVTTCEIKSGYGLSEQSERKQLEAIRAVASDNSLPAVVPTYLALHALAPEDRPNRAAWVDEVVERSVPAVARDRLARFVDAYIDRNAFSVQEAEKLFSAARRVGLGIRAHVGQFADIGGASLAASMGAASVDHVENVSEAALSELAAASTVVVLLPLASFTLRQQPPPIAAMRKAGVRLAVASDANPGTAPTESLPLALAFALHTYGLTPEECLLGATRYAALSLQIEREVGSLDPGKSADIVLWDLDHEHAILQPWGSPMTRWVSRSGRVLFDADERCEHAARC